MTTISGTQIGADGRRHPIDELPDAESSRKRWPWDRRDPAKRQPKVALDDAPVETDQAAVSVGEVVAHPDEEALRTQASGVAFGPKPEPEADKSLDDMTHDELVEFADDRDLAIHRSARVDDLRDEVDFLTKPVAEMTKKECVEYAERSGIELSKSGTVAELRAELEAALADQ